MLYHVSPQSGLKVLRPHVAGHGKAYVYALENQVTGLLFGAKWDDFDFDLSNEPTGRAVLSECYPGALEKVYKGESCSVYTVREEGFLRGQTGWDEELVCEQEVPVLSETRIPDLYRRLLEEERAGRLVLRQYEHTPEYRRMIAGHVTDRLFQFEIDLEHCLEQDERFATHYRELILTLREAVDGHLLA